MNADTSQVIQQLNNIDQLQDVLNSGNIQVRVTDSHVPPLPLEGTQIVVQEGATIVAQGQTDTNGEVVLEIDFGDMNLFATKTVRIMATRDGFTPREKTVTVIAVSTIDVNLVLTP